MATPTHLPLVQGDYGWDVGMVQQALNGYTSFIYPQLVVDKDFGPATAAAVAEYRAYMELDSQDGMNTSVDQTMWTRLGLDYAPQPGGTGPSAAQIAAATQAQAAQLNAQLQQALQSGASNSANQIAQAAGSAVAGAGFSAYSQALAGMIPAGKTVYVMGTFYSALGTATGFPLQADLNRWAQALGFRSYSAIKTDSVNALGGPVYGTLTLQSPKSVDDIASDAVAAWGEGGNSGSLGNVKVSMTPFSGAPNSTSNYLLIGGIVLGLLALVEILRD